MKNKKLPGDLKCTICEGVGYLPLEETDPEFKRLVDTFGEFASVYATVKRCECLEDIRFGQKVGRSIYQAREIESDLLRKVEQRNVFLNVSRPTFLAHLRSYLKDRYESMFWVMKTDMDLLDIFLGKTEDYNSVANFAKTPDLLILQLGFQSYSNKSLPGIVFECLKTREFHSKPTWVVNPPDAAFREGHFAWSPELEWYLDEHYKTVRIPSLTTKSKTTVKEVPNPFVSKPKDRTAKGSAKFQDISL